MAGENTKLTGTLLISAISPYNSTDTYPTHYAKYGHGGYRTVSNIDELEAIPKERIEEGMLVYVATEDKIYKYKDDGFAILELGSGNSDEALTEAKAYTDELANGAVKTNTEAIATLNGTGEGSVDKKVAEAIAEIVASAPEDFDTLKEIADYIESDKTGAAELSNTVAELEGKAHTHDNKNILDGITAEKVSAWDNAEQNAKDYADGLAVNYDAAGSAEAAESAAKAYADGLAVNYDAAGAAATAEQNAKDYANSLAGNYDAAGAAATAESAAKAYADGLAGNYDAAGTAASEAASAEQNAKDYSDELIKKYPVLEIVNDNGNIDIYNQNNCINFYTNPEKKTLVSHPMRYVNGYKEQGIELNNVAEGNYSTVIGYGCNTVGGSSNSFCGGDVSTTSHANCFVYGEGLNTITSNETVIGRFNNFANFEQWGDNKPLFEVGGGSGNSNRITMFMVQKNTGIVFAHSAFKVEGMGDFAEYFEWFDGNPNNEDRMGYMVQLNGEKIEIATTFKNCIGITSGTNSFTADSASLDWHGRFLKDDFGRPIYEKLENGEVRQKLNPDYNPSEEYIPRMYRKEWIPVGLVGKILTRQDGTLNVGDLAGCLNGVATKSTDGNGYRVLKIINDKIALLLVK